MSDLAELIRKAMEHRLADVRTAMPVRVKSYDVDAQTVDVIPLVREITETDGDDIEEALPVIPSVPVAFPRAGGFFITFPIVPGDTGQVVICDRSIDQWRTRGSDSFTPDHGYAVHPLDKRRHGLSGAVFYPGLSDTQNPLSDAHASNLVLGKDGGSSIHIKPSGEVALGEESPTEKMLLGTIFRSAQATMDGALQTQFSGENTAWAAIAAPLATALTGELNPVGPGPFLVLYPQTGALIVAMASAMATVAASSGAKDTAVANFEVAAAANQDFQSNKVKTAR